jgi:sensor histidine kinase YesM
MKNTGANPGVFSLNRKSVIPAEVHTLIQRLCCNFLRCCNFKLGKMRGMDHRLPLDQPLPRIKWQGSKIFKERKLTVEYLLLFFSVLLIILFISLILFNITNKRKELFEEMVIRNEKLGQVYGALDKMDVFFNDYAQTSSKVERLPDYQKLIINLDKALEEVKRISVNRQVILDFIRRIHTFNEFQWEYLCEAIPRQDTSQHESIVFVRRGITVHKNYFQYMQNADLTITEAFYRDRMLDLDNEQLALNITSMIILLFSIFPVLSMTRRLLKEAGNIHAYISLLAEKKWDIPDIKPGPYKEINEFSSILNRMKHEIADYLDQLRSKQFLEKQLFEAHIGMLKAQINPHFLFNALNTIAKVSFGNPEKIMELVEAVSKIMRYSLDTQDHFVFLGDEIAIIESYVLIQKARFENTFTFSVDVDEPVFTTPIPSMIIQPIIENCFKHAFGYKTTVNIKFSAFKSPEGITLIIEDDGCGFDVSILQKEKNQGIGLNNVSSRLLMEYKRKDIFSVTSELGKFTKVLIIIPDEAPDDRFDSRR